MKRHLVLISLMLLITSNTDAALPSPFTAGYSLETKGIEFATMQRRFFVAASGDYIFRSESKATGIAAVLVPGEIVEQSVLTVSKRQPRPLTYSYRRTGRKPKQIETRFDWNTGEVSGGNGKRSWQLKLESLTFDKLLYQLAIMNDLHAGKRKLVYRIMDEDKLKIYEFAAVGEETLSTPLGRLRTLKLSRVNEKKNRSTTLWCAIDLHYLPVRLEKVRDGKTDLALIQTLTGLKKNPTISELLTDPGVREARRSVPADDSAQGDSAVL